MTEVITDTVPQEEVDTEAILDEICGYLRNYFVVKKDGYRKGKYTISGGSISCNFLQEGQYFRIKGSVFNDGVWQYPTDELTDEVFEGEIWCMAVPPAVITIIGEIDAWSKKYGGLDSVNMSPFTSESFNNYSYSKGSRNRSSGSSGSVPMTWSDVFGSKLARWRKI